MSSILLSCVGVILSVSKQKIPQFIPLAVSFSPVLMRRRSKEATINEKKKQGSNKSCTNEKKKQESKLVASMRLSFDEQSNRKKVHKLEQKSINFSMGHHYLNWAHALASAWGFMLLVGLMGCCLSTTPREHGSISSGMNDSCSCDGGHVCV